MTIDHNQALSDSNKRRIFNVREYSPRRRRVHREDFTTKDTKNTKVEIFLKKNFVSFVIFVISFEKFFSPRPPRLCGEISEFLFNSANSVSLR